MSIKLLKSGVWEIRYYTQKRTVDPITRKQTNEGRARVLFNGSEAEARDYYATLLRAQRTPAIAVLVPTLNQAWPDFCLYYENKNSPTTYRDFLCTRGKHLEPYFGKLRPRDFSPTLIEQYKQYRLKQNTVRGTPPARKTISKELSYLAAILTWMSDPENNRCSPLPFTIKGFSGKQNAPPPLRVPTRSEVIRLLRRTRPIFRALFATCYYAGLRRSEALSLTRVTVNMEQGILLIVGKGNKFRAVPIFRKLRPYLARLLRKPLAPGVAPEQSWLFANPKTGKPYVEIKKALNRAATNAGLPHTWLHLLRHAFGTHAVQSGIDLRTTQLLMGHSSSQVTERYTTLAATFLAEQLNRLGSGSQSRQKKQKIKQS